MGIQSILKICPDRNSRIYSPRLCKYNLEAFRKRYTKTGNTVIEVEEF